MKTQISKITTLFIKYPKMLCVWNATEFVFLSDDSLILRRQDGRQIHMHRKQSAELANLKAQKAADIIQSGNKSKK